MSNNGVGAADMNNYYLVNSLNDEDEVVIDKNSSEIDDEDSNNSLNRCGDKRKSIDMMKNQLLYEQIS